MHTNKLRRKAGFVLNKLIFNLLFSETIKNYSTGLAITQINIYPLRALRTPADLAIARYGDCRYHDYVQAAYVKLSLVKLPVLNFACEAALQR